MLYGRMKNYKIERPTYIEDAFNHSRQGWADEGTALIEIVVQDRSEINNNDLDLYKTTLVGYTRNTNISKGWRIDERYIVKSTTPHRTATVLYLEEYQDGR